jgi:hypothetical protein
VIQIQEPYVDTQMVIKEYQCRCTIQQQMGWKTQFKFVAKIQQTKAT